jgi:transcriptional antiterminator RfaH
MSYWSVVQCETRMLVHSEHRGETLAERIFARKGFESYLPQVRSRQHGTTKIAPLFPGYIIVRVVERWYAVRWTMGVVRVLMAGDEPARLPDPVVEDIRRREVGGFIKLPPPPPKNSPLKIGQRARILTGSFRGHIALYDGQTAQERERVLINLLGRQVAVTLNPTDRLAALPLVSPPDSGY